MSQSLAYQIASRALRLAAQSGQDRAHISVDVWEACKSYGRKSLTNRAREWGIRINTPMGR